MFTLPNTDEASSGSRKLDLAVFGNGSPTRPLNLRSNGNVKPKIASGPRRKWQKRNIILRLAQRALTLSLDHDVLTVIMTAYARPQQSIKSIIDNSR